MARKERRGVRGSVPLVEHGLERRQVRELVRQAPEGLEDAGDLALGPLELLRGHLRERAAQLIVEGDHALDAGEPPEPPYWAHLWSGAAVLAAAVPRDARRVLELGCGLGLPGFGRALLTDAGRIDTRAFYAELDAAGLTWRASDEPVREEGLPLTVKLVEEAHGC